MSGLSTSLSFIGLPGGAEWIIIAIIGLLIFGKRLPDVGKSLGKSIVEFKKGLRGIEEEIDKSVEQDQTEMLPPPDEQNNTPSDTKNETAETEKTPRVEEPKD
ncbi:MAG: twin-arginine translocase TatA/TatE family subunit [Planctomycetota bacterium]